jgi:hypothetical protein
MRVLGLALGGSLALTATVAAQAAPLGSHMGPAAAGPARHRASMGWQSSGLASGAQRWGRWLASDARSLAPMERRMGSAWGPNGPPGGSGPGAPTYWVWGPSGGAFDYPFADWRGPTGGWGNP